VNATLRLHVYLLFATFIPFTLGCFVPEGLAQEAPNVSEYIDPATAYHTADFDSVDLFNGRVGFNIPLVEDHSQRGNLNFTYSLRYASSTTWVQIPYNLYYYRFVPAATSGVIATPMFSMDGLLSFGTDEVNPCAPSDWCWQVGNYARDNTGEKHYLGTTPAGFESVDGSGIQGLIGPDGQYELINRNGVRFYSYGGYSFAEDPNGNLLTFSTSYNVSNITDTVGRGWTYSIGGGNVGACPVAAVSADLWQVPGTSGSSRNFQFCYSNIQISTSFNVPGVYDYNQGQSLLTAVILPDNTFWQFDYDNYGDVITVHLPTGGMITYEWATGNDNQIPGAEIRYLTRRKRFDGTNWATWTYTLPGDNYGDYKTTVTDPLNNDTVYYPVTISTECDNRTDHILYYQGLAGNGGTLLKTISYAYQVLDDPYPSDLQACGVSALPTSTITQNDLNQQMGVTTAYDHGNLDLGFTDDNSGSQHYSVYGLPTQQNVYDWGSGTVGPVLTQDFKSYVATDLNSDYLAVNNLDLVFEDAFYGTNGNCCFVTYFGIDGSDPVASGVTMQHITAPSGAIGNLTSIVRYDSTTNSNVTVATYTNYDTGMRATVADALNHTTNYYYANENPNWYGSRLTSAANALGQTVNYAYDWPSGLINWFQDLNSNWTQYIFDNMFRPTQITYPDAGQTNFTYSSYNGFMYTLEARKIDNNNRWTSFYTMYDGLGRPFRTATYDDDSPNYDQVDSCFDALGNVGFRSYPYRSSGFNASPVCSGAEGAGDTFAYDALNRVKQVTHSDGSYTLTSYSGRATSLTDEGNFSSAATRISQADGLGRITSICEVSNNTQLGTAGTPSACGQDIAGTGFPTTYAYDALNNVTNVSQGGYRNRTFNYDSFSRLTSATNPESGTTNYYYQTSGGAFCAGDLSLPCRRTDARGITMSYSYETLNRLSSKTYSDTTPGAYFYYDASSWWGHSVSNPVGRLVANGTYIASTGVWPTAENFTYDVIGRTTQEYSCLPIVCWSAGGPPAGIAIQSYGYDYVGDLVSGTNGEGVTLNYSYNQALRLTGVTSSLNDSNHPGTLLSGAHYNAAGSLTSTTLDNGAIVEARTYDGRFRLTAMSDNAIGLSYSWAIPSNGYAPNSNIVAVNDSVNGNWSYGYDPFNRLASASTSGQSYTYAYDRFGNRWQQNGTHPMIESFTGNNNRMDPGTAGYTYDAAGNLTYDGTTTYTYDAENRVISAYNQSNGTTTYVYDAEGRRVRKKVNGVATDFLYDPNGKEIAAVNGSGAWLRGEVYGAGRHLATYYGGTTYFNFADHLGTERVRANMSAPPPYETCTSLPFGDWLNCTGGDASPMHFTGQERDSESGLDNFGARYDSSSLGRFMTPDPLGGSLADPQTLNKYAYVRNNPLNLTDPTGLYTCRDDPADGSSHCSSDADRQFELARQQDLQSKNNKDVVRAAQAYGDPNSSNGVTVGFANLGRGGEGGIATSYLATDSNDNPQAHSDVTLNSNDLGKVGSNSVSTAFAADVGHEGSHVADAQDIFKSIISGAGGNYTVGTIISQYSSEQRAYKVTDAIYRSANESYNGCGNANCALGAGSSPIGLGQRIDQILLAHPDVYHSSDGRPLTSTNQGGNVLNLTVPH
jgi:RHS repeat-associated protein